MRKRTLIAGMAAGLLIAVPGALSAQPPPPPPHHHHHHGGGSSGVRLATDIVNLVKAAVTPAVVVAPAPAPVVVAPAPAPAAVVVAPEPSAYEYRYYNGYRVVYHNGWYWYNSVWTWGGPGPAPYHCRPGWRPVPPPPRHYHHAPPPPPRHYHHAPPPPSRHAPPSRYR